MTFPSITMTLYCNELRILLRDRRTILMSIVLPLLLMPIMLFGSSFLQRRQEQKLQTREFLIAVTGSQAEKVRSILVATRNRLDANDKEKGTFRFKYLPVAGLAAAVLLFISSYARSYKEAQLYFFPIFLLGLLPGLVTFLPGLRLRSAIVLVPVANIAMAVKETLIGIFDWPLIAAAWLVTAGAALWATRAAVDTLSNERLITATQLDQAVFHRGAALFERQVLRWFALIWALLLLANPAWGRVPIFACSSFST